MYSDTLAEGFAVRVGEILVAFIGLFVNIDLPSHTAGMTASGGNTAKFGIVIRYKNKFHHPLKGGVGSYDVPPMKQYA